MKMTSKLRQHENVIKRKIKNQKNVKMSPMLRKRPHLIKFNLRWKNSKKNVPVKMSQLR